MIVPLQPHSKVIKEAHVTHVGVTRIEFSSEVTISCQNLVLVSKFSFLFC